MKIKFCRVTCKQCEIWWNFVGSKQYYGAHSWYVLIINYTFYKRSEDLRKYNCKLSRLSCSFWVKINNRKKINEGKNHKNMNQILEWILISFFYHIYYIFPSKPTNWFQPAYEGFQTICKCKQNGIEISKNPVSRYPFYNSPWQGLSWWITEVTGGIRMNNGKNELIVKEGWETCDSFTENVEIAIRYVTKNIQTS